MNELKEILRKKMYELELSDKFKSNPAFEKVVRDINDIFLQRMVPNDVQIEGNEKTINFDWVDSITKEAATIRLSMTGPDTLKYITISKAPSYLEEEYIGNRNNYKECTVTGEEDGAITIESNSSFIVNNRDNPLTESKCLFSRGVSKFTSDGILKEEELIYFPEMILETNAEKMSLEESLMPIRTMASNPKLLEESYSLKEHLIRDKFDTAQVLYENRDLDYKFIGKSRLDINRSLGNMVLPYEIGAGEFEKEILPMSPWEIEKIINKEQNEKIKEGLKKYAEGREDYYYNTEEDPDFVCEKGSQKHL